MNVLHRFVFQSICAALAFSAADFARSQVPDSKNFYPLEEGTQWTYKVNAAGQTKSIVLRVAKVETIDGQKLARIETVNDGAISATEHLCQNDKGVFRHRMNGIELSPPLQLLRYPVQDGDSWTSENDLGGGTKRKMSMKVSTEKVTVPTGTYQAVVLAIELKDGDPPVLSKLWLVADVGVVKQYIKADTFEMTTELEKFEPGAIGSLFSK